MSRRYRTAHPCPSPSKQRFPTLEDAYFAYQRNVDNPSMNDLQLADWAYRCMCGAWHRTKRHDEHLGGTPLG